MENTICNFTVCNFWDWQGWMTKRTILQWKVHRYRESERGGVRKIENEQQGRYCKNFNNVKQLKCSRLSISLYTYELSHMLVLSSSMKIIIFCCVPHPRSHCFSLLIQKLYLATGQKSNLIESMHHHSNICSERASKRQKIVDCFDWFLHSMELKNRNTGSGYALPHTFNMLALTSAHTEQIKSI